MKSRTTQTLTAVILLFVSILLLSLLCARKTARICQELLTLTDECNLTGRRGDVANAYCALEEFQTVWSSHHLFFAATQHHDDMDAVSNALRTAFYQMENGIQNDIDEQLASISYTLEKMQEIQQCSFENIL